MGSDPLVESSITILHVSDMQFGKRTAAHQRQRRLLRGRFGNQRAVCRLSTPLFEAMEQLYPRR